MLATSAPGYVDQHLDALLPGVQLHRGVPNGCLNARHVLRRATAGEGCTWACPYCCQQAQRCGYETAHVRPLINSPRVCVPGAMVPA